MHGKDGWSTFFHILSSFNTLYNIISALEFALAGKGAMHTVPEIIVSQRILSAKEQQF